MWCKMDCDDPHVTDVTKYRHFGCTCQAPASIPKIDCGCQCPSCEATCKACPGFGYVQARPRRFHQILTGVKSQIKRRVRIRGHPPGYVRLSEAEIRVLLRKRDSEECKHWINDYVDLGPPLRIFDVIIVVDRRREYR